MSDVQIYTTTYCGYCNAAKALLAKRGIPYEEIDVTHDDGKRVWLVGATGQRTVPQIFIKGESIGGYTELAKLDGSGELTKRLGE